MTGAWLLAEIKSTQYEFRESIKIVFHYHCSAIIWYGIILVCFTKINILL